MMLLKKFFAALLALAMSLTLSAALAEDNSLQAILDKGTFIIGLDDSFPPMGYRDENNDIVGFDIDVARAVAEKLGVEFIAQPISWEAKELELSSGNIDCIWNGMTRQSPLWPIWPARAWPYRMAAMPKSFSSATTTPT